MSQTNPADRQETPIGRLDRRWLVDNGPPDAGESEQETAARSDRLADALESLTKSPAITWGDADAKLLILSVRLRQAAKTADPETLVLALLAVSIQHDLVRLRV